jgi:hypothetical protein
LYLSQNFECFDLPKGDEDSLSAANIFHTTATEPQPPVRLNTTRAIAVGEKKHFTCDLVFGPGSGQVMRVESLTEKRIALVLLARIDVAKLENQVPFAWVEKDGSRHTHFFDFRATLTNGSRVAIMVKYEKKLEQDDFRALIARISSQVLPSFADRVTVMTEKDVDPVDLYNATLVNSIRGDDPEADAVMREVVASMAGYGKIGDLIENTGLGARGFRSIVRLIGSHEIELQQPTRISYDSQVTMRRAA